MRNIFKSAYHFLPLSCAVFCAVSLYAQVATPPPVNFTSDQDHQNMMDQLGIKALRPGPSGNEKAPNHANYDESQGQSVPQRPRPANHSTTAKR